MLCAIGSFLGAGVINANAAQSKTSGSAELAAPLTTDELVELFHGRSWLWKDGAGYFSAKQRRFTAWSREEGGSLRMLMGVGLSQTGESSASRQNGMRRAAPRRL
jgi:hypothetical protein